MAMTSALTGASHPRLASQRQVGVSAPARRHPSIGRLYLARVPHPAADNGDMGRRIVARLLIVAVALALNGAALMSCEKVTGRKSAW